MQHPVSLPELDVVTNQLVLELATVKDKHYQCTFYIFRQWLRKLFGRRWPEQAPTPQAITRSVVGLRITHHFEVDGELSWYEGTVLKINADTVEFEVKYDGEDDTYWFPLLEDMLSGDLLIM